MDQLYAGWDWLVANWALLAVVVVPFATTFLAKLGRIGAMFISILSAVKDGVVTDEEKVRIFDDAVAVMSGWLPNRSKAVK